MTECERIIKEGILPESYFNDEVKCDYLITKQQKKIWAVELDLLLQFVKVCEENNLKYFLFGGTLLGAIRHQGFIPWDDDIDVGMPRKDYEEFLKHYNDFKEPYFLQTPETDSGSGYIYAKLRNSNTTCLIKKFAYNKELNQGIFIDIFPFDEWNIENGIERRNQIEKLAFENSIFMRKDNPYLSELDQDRVNNLKKDFNPVDNFVCANKIAKSFADEGKKEQYLAHLMFGEPFYFPKECFENFQKAKFENYLFNIPCKYDEMLTVSYKDYMQLPAKEKRTSIHNDCIFDANIDYKSFIKEWVRKKE